MMFSHTAVVMQRGKLVIPVKLIGIVNNRTIPVVLQHVLPRQPVDQGLYPGMLSIEQQRHAFGITLLTERVYAAHDTAVLFFLGTAQRLFGSNLFKKVKTSQTGYFEYSERHIRIF